MAKAESEAKKVRANNTPLTQEQQVFAEKNIAAVHYFLNRNRLSEDEYFDIVIFGYLRAVRAYLEQERLRQYSFYTIAKWQMYSAMSTHYRKQKRRAPLLSLDYDTAEDLPKAQYPDPAIDDFLEMLILKEEVEQALALLDLKQQKMFELKAQGYMDKEIAKLFGIKKATAVTSSLTRARKKAKAAISEV